MTNQPYCLGASKAKAKEKEEVVGSAECAIHPESPYQTVTKTLMMRTRAERKVLPRAARTRRDGSLCEP